MPYFCCYFKYVIFIYHSDFIILALLLSKERFYEFVSYLYYYWIIAYFTVIIVTFFVICCFYSSIVENYHYFYLNKNAFSDDFSCKNISIERCLESLIQKFIKLNKHQKLINKCFGEIVTRVLVFHSFWLILLPLLSRPSEGAFKFSNLPRVMSFIWSFCGLYTICISPNIVINKVSILIKN